MPQIGPLEILAVGVIALVVFGPQRLPEIARNIGKAINELRRMSSEVRDELREGMTVADTDEPEPPEPAKAVPADPDEQER
ncbi:MAG TPA: Sec-independent protein translocase protein TatB [Actinomycetota bacterium]|nr:Sec-independent protein translocase protein TatB [Actinomycetota bacterium]